MKCKCWQFSSPDAISELTCDDLVLKVGRVCIIMRGRYAGKKVHISASPYLLRRVDTRSSGSHNPTSGYGNQSPSVSTCYASSSLSAPNSSNVFQASRGWRGIRRPSREECPKTGRPRHLRSNHSLSKVRRQMEVESLDSSLSKSLLSFLRSSWYSLSYSELQSSHANTL